jgi:predicted RNA-binding Zn-ribbon protein involved in translation (DUF1610 family)
MAKQTLYCESCDTECTVSHKKPKTEIEAFYCPFCGEEIDVGWNTLDEDESNA